MGRRTLIAGMSSSLLFASAMESGAASLTTGLSDVLDNFVPFPPEPVKFPRRNLDQKFAVLLMRTAYEAVDELDFIPMDEFQVRFWKTRQAEYEPYALQYSPLRVKPGDLTDPLYFDFISFVQYETISREFVNGKQVFKEYCSDCADAGQDPYIVVRRDPALRDNAELPRRFERMVGDGLYGALLNGFLDTTFGAPAPLPGTASLRDVATELQAILDVMVGRGYALSARVAAVQPDASGKSGTFTVEVQGPANQYGLSALQFRRSSVLNAYDALITESYLRQCGKNGTFRLQKTDEGFVQNWVVTA